MKRLIVLIGFLLTAGHALAQQPPAPPAAPAPPAPASRPAPAQTPKLLPPAAIAPAPAPPAPPAPPVAPGPPRQPINVRVDLTITEEGGGAPVRKTVSTVAGDGFSGSVREIATLTAPGSGGPTQLNFDATPIIVVEDRARGGVNLVPPSATQKIRVGFNIQYTAGQGGAGEQRPRTDIRLNMTPILENGKPLKVWDGADPIDRDRRVTVEVTATILK